MSISSSSHAASIQPGSVPSQRHHPVVPLNEIKVSFMEELDGGADGMPVARFLSLGLMDRILNGDHERKNIHQ